MLPVECNSKLPDIITNNIRFNINRRTTADSNNGKENDRDELIRSITPQKNTYERDEETHTIVERRKFKVTI
jgi:hypothetical protein